MSNLQASWLLLEDKLRSFIFSKVHDTALTEDLLQDTYLRIHANIHSLRDSSRLQPWIYQIARNLVTDHFRTRPHQSAPAEIPEDPVDQEVDPAAMSEAIQDMIHFMDQMPPSQCEALCSTEIRGMSIGEYAESAGISYTAAKTRVHRAKKELREMMLACCHYEFDKFGTVLEISPKKKCCTP